MCTKQTVQQQDYKNAFTSIVIVFTSEDFSDRFRKRLTKPFPISSGATIPLYFRHILFVYNYFNGYEYLLTREYVPLAPKQRMTTFIDFYLINENRV